MSIKHEFRKLLWKIGYDVSISKFDPGSHPLAQKKQIFTTYGIDTVLDIGANSGQFAQNLRKTVGFSGHILSFEPQSKAFELLNANSKNDPTWDIFNYAIGDIEGKQEINISNNSFSSSLLNILPTHIEAEPNSGYVGKETITIKPLDSLFWDLCKDAINIYMKIDTQGFESKVLKGAKASLSHINTIQMEMSLVPLYEGELLFNEMCFLMSKKGYTLIAIKSGFSDPKTGQTLQVDGFFHRF